MEMAGSNCKLSDVSFCALDLETTGTNPALHRIVEVGIIRFTLDEIAGTYESLVNPGMRIPEEVVRIHGITDEMVAGSPRMEDLLDDVSSMLQNSVLVIQNPQFDMSFLTRAYQMNDVAAPVMVAIDTVRLSRRAYPNLHDHKLGTICSHLDLNLSHHRALSDASGCMEIFKRIIGEMDPAGGWRLSDLTAYHGSFIQPKYNSWKRIADIGKKIMGIQLGSNIGIRYLDQAGTVTNRMINPREFITYHGETYVFAFCYLRNDMRYFNINRIIMID